MAKKVSVPERAGRLLHDEVGPLLAAAGLKLQLLKMDLPQAGPQVDETLQIMEQAMEHVRSASRVLIPSPFAAPRSRRLKAAGRLKA
jgi:signal transduction histidine kinase